VVVCSARFGLLLNTLHTIKQRKANETGYILHRNFLLKHIIERNIEERTEVTGRRKEEVSSYCMILRKGKDP